MDNYTRREFLRILGIEAVAVPIGIGLTYPLDKHLEKNKVNDLIKAYEFEGHIRDQRVVASIDHIDSFFKPNQFSLSVSETDEFGGYIRTPTGITTTFHAEGYPLKLYGVVQKTEDKFRFFQRDTPKGKVFLEKAQSNFDDYLRKILEQKKLK